MSILQLDEYSVQEIFLYLDIQSHKHLACTCKKLHAFSKQFHNMRRFQKDLQYYLIKLLFKNHNRYKIPAYLKLQYQTVFSLKALCQTMNVCQYLKNKKVSDKTNIMDQLIRRAVDYSSSASNVLSHLCEIGFQCGIDMNFWYTFEFGKRETIYLCNVELSFKIRQKDFKNVVVGIYTNEQREEKKFYCCNITRFDWFDSQLSTAEFSNSYDVLKPICGYLKKLFAKTTLQRQITPKALFELATFECQTTTEAATAIVEENVTDPTEDQTIQKVITRMKNKFAGEIALIENSDAIHQLLGNLKYCFTICSENYKFLMSLADFVRPITKLLSLFNSKKLLSHLPVVKLLLRNVDLSELVVEKYKETVSLVLNNNKLKVEKNREELFYQVTLNKDVLLTIHEKDGGVEAVVLPSIDLLMKAFAEFINLNFNNAVVNTLPDVSVEFIFMFLDNFLSFRYEPEIISTRKRLLVQQNRILQEQTRTNAT